MGNAKKLAWVLSCTALALTLGVGASASLTGSSTSDSAVAPDDVALTDSSTEVSTEPGSGDEELDSSGDVSDETAATDTAESDDEAREHPENHGKYVSRVAKCVPPGPEHGKAVSEMARTHENEAAKAEELCSRYADESSGGSSTADGDDAVGEDDSDADANNAGARRGKNREAKTSPSHRGGGKVKHAKR